MEDNVEAPDPARVPVQLLEREAARQEEVERRRQAREARLVPEEQSDYFRAIFNRERKAIEALLEPEPSEAAEAEPTSEAVVRLEEGAERLRGLQRLVSNSVRFLAPYDLRIAQEKVNHLRSVVAERRLQLQPPKPFAFRARKKELPGPRPPQGASEPGPRKLTASAFASLPADPPCGFSRAEGQELELGATELLQRDVTLSRLSRCRVQLRGNPNTLLMRDCHECTVLCGPVSTSALVEGCSGCVLALACQQLRTHRTTETSFYVLVTSRAMLEDCSSIRFAPYTWSYPGIEADFLTSTLDKNRNNWNQVDDFNWLVRDQPSPNWSVIPEQDRISDWSQI